MLLEDLMSSFQARKTNRPSAEEAPALKDSSAEVVAPDSSSATSATADIQEILQSKMQDAASAAGSLFQSSAGELVKEEVDIKQQMQGLIVPESKNDVLSLILGVGGAAAVLLLAVIIQAVQRSQSDKVCEHQRALRSTLMKPVTHISSSGCNAACWNQHTLHAQDMWLCTGRRSIMNLMVV
jgi:protein subunit release factor A